MRNGQQLGALLGYLLERGIHDASGVNGIEIDWVVFELRRQYPLKVDTIDNAPQASAERLVADGWKLAQVETKTPGAVVAAIPAPTGAGQPTFGAAEKNALQSAISDVVATLDAFTDLGLAESMYQLAGANFERAAAATDMIGRASSPPDVFESVATPRGGRGIEQRLVVTFGSSARPAGVRNATRRARASRRPRMRSLRGGSARSVRSACVCWTHPVPRSPRRRYRRSDCRRSTSRRSISRPKTSCCRASMRPRPCRARPTRTRGGRASRACCSRPACPDAVTVGFDLTLDAELLDLLDHAAAWQHALAGAEAACRPRRSSRARSSIRVTGHLEPRRHGRVARARAQCRVAGRAEGLGNRRTDATAARAAADGRVAAAAAISDPVKAAGVLLGGPAVVEGSFEQSAARTSARPSAIRPPSSVRARACWRAGCRTPRAFVRLPRA